MLKTDDFDYTLPLDRIAQQPPEQRDAGRLLVLNRVTGEIQHRQFTDISEYFDHGDILVANNSRVLPARLYGRKVESGGKVELLLLEQKAADCWRILVGGKRLGQGVQINVVDLTGEPSGLVATITKVLEGPEREACFNQSLGAMLDKVGHTPLPPYIHRQLSDPERYQTVYNRESGSVAAPTAGLHFTGDVLLTLRQKGVLFDTVTLHIGLDTFKPVEAALVADHSIHSEWATLSPDTARRINEVKLSGGRLIAVGTTSVRVLESAALRSAGIGGSLLDISRRDAAGETTNLCPWRPVSAFEGRTDLFVYPGYNFRAVDAMITNFHLPKSSLIMLVSAFCDRHMILRAYETAVAQGYRFFSFGDAMLIY